MNDPARARLYLTLPLDFDPATFGGPFGAALDAGDVACVRAPVGERDEAAMRAAIAAVKPACHARDIALLLENAYPLAKATGLDGVHLTDGARRVSAARAALGQEASIGAFCGVSKHQGLLAGEASADYVSFGPVAGSSALAPEGYAEDQLFVWWRDVVETPVVAEGGLVLDQIAHWAAQADFLMLGPELWRADDPAAHVAAAQAAIERAR